MRVRLISVNMAARVGKVARASCSALLRSYTVRQRLVISDGISSYLNIPHARFTAAFAARSFCSQALQEAQADPKSVYVFNIEGRRHNAPLLVGLMDFFLRRDSEVGFFQPIAGLPYANSSTGWPRNIELLKRVFNSSEDSASMMALPRMTFIDMLSKNQSSEISQILDQAWRDYAPRHKITICEGTHADGPVGVPGDRVELNAKLASQMGSPVLMTLDVRPGVTIADAVNSAAIARDTIVAANGYTLGIVLQCVPSDQLKEAVAEFRKLLEPLGITCFGGLPESRILSTTSLGAIANALGTQLLAGRELLLEDNFTDVVVAAGDLKSVLCSTEGRPLVVVPASRADIILAIGAAQAAGSRDCIVPAGVLVTDLNDLDPHVRKLLEGDSDGALFTAPVLATAQPLSQVLNNIGALRSEEMLPSSTAKIQASKALFGRYIDGDGLAAAIHAPPVSEQLTPRLFMHNLQRRAQSIKKRIVLPEGSDARILKAAAEVTQRGFADVTLLGKPDDIRKEAEKLGADIQLCEIVDPTQCTQLPHYIDMLVEARKHKGTTREMAADMLTDVNYVGTMMIAAGDADGMVSGAAHTTAATIRPALQVLRSSKTPLVSSCFFMCLPKQVMVFGDCAVNPNPSAEDLAQIAIASADTAVAFGIHPPRVALLSYSTGTSGSGDDVEKVRKATGIVKDQRPDLFVEGPLQYDAAVDPATAASKVKGPSEVAGQANVLIFPSLNAGNVAYKAVQASSAAVAMGPLMQGLRLPVNDLSRGCTVDDVINTVLCTAVQAQAAAQ